MVEGRTSRPSARSLRQKKGVSIAMPWPAIAALPSLACVSRRMPWPSGPSGTSSPTSLSQCGHQSSCGLIRGSRSRSSGLDPAAVPREEVGAAHRREIDPEQEIGLEPRPAAAPGPDRDVDIVADEVGQGVVADSRTASSGWAIWKPPSRQASQVLANVCEVEMVRVACVLGAKLGEGGVQTSNARASSGASRRPASVSSTRPLARVNRGRPSRSSNKRI